MKETTANPTRALGGSRQAGGGAGGKRWPKVTGTCSADGLGMSLLETEAERDSKGIGLSNDGTAKNSHGAVWEEERPGAQFGPTLRVMPMRRPRGGAEWAVGCRSLKLCRESGLRSRRVESGPHMCGTQSHRPG